MKRSKDSAAGPRGPKGPGARADGFAARGKRPPVGGPRADRQERQDRQERRPFPVQRREVPVRRGFKRLEREVAVVSTPTSPAQMAARIIARSNERQPADLLLRQALARRRGLRPEEATWISRSVFAYFRWQNWLDASQTLEERIEAALALAQRFESEPGWPSDVELVEKAIPAWVASEGLLDASWARSLQREPVLWLRIQPGKEKSVADALEAGSLVQGPLPESFRYTGSVDLFTLDEFHKGFFEIQDIASQAVAHVCSARPSEVWWDACAGEGGKTLHLAVLMEGQGLIWASDRAAWRLERLRQRAARAQCFNHRRVAWDGGAKPPTKTQFDGVLLDAPCSGMGTWGRNPHARWTATPNDVTELATIQRSLLENVSASVKPGGRLVYAVCTLSRAETTAIADAFTAAHPEFEPCAFANPLDLKAEPAAQLTLWPQQTMGNGMFMAAWERRPEPAPASPSKQATPGAAADAAS